jgi:hypothetical protein
MTLLMDHSLAWADLEKHHFGGRKSLILSLRLLFLTI